MRRAVQRRGETVGEAAQARPDQDQQGAGEAAPVTLGGHAVAQRREDRAEAAAGAGEGDGAGHARKDHDGRGVGKGGVTPVIAG
jgi:hypothetical protein